MTANWTTDVMRWGSEKYRTWLLLAASLTPPTATPEQIKAAKQRAYDRIRDDAERRRRPGR